MRAAKSSKQYAGLLLKKGMMAKADDLTIEEVVNKLSDGYFSHGYPIDREEAKANLGLAIEFVDGALWERIWDLYFSYFHEMFLRRDAEVPFYNFIETAETIKNLLDHMGIDVDEAIRGIEKKVDQESMHQVATDIVNTQESDIPETVDVSQEIFTEARTEEITKDDEESCSE